MKIAYLIMAHKDPAHLHRLIQAISTPNTTCYIHLDKKSDMFEFTHLENSNVHFIKKRLPIYYDYSLVEATLELMRNALDDRRQFEYFIRLHGVDYPVQPAAYIENFFNERVGSEFIEIMPTKAGDKDFPYNRIRKIEFPKNATLLEKLIVDFSSRFGSQRDRIKEFNEFGLLPFWGSALWGLSRNACEYILKYLQTNQKIMHFFRYTHAPEEMIFQTILGNSSYLEKVANYFHYVDWSSQQRHPPELTERHLVLFSSSLQVIYENREILFANKFTSEDGQVVDKLNEIIIEKDKLYQARNTW